MKAASRAARLALLLAAASACRGTGDVQGYAVRTGGDAERGRQVIRDRQCGVCHRIPGVEGADGVLAVPLVDFAQRSFIAGLLPNTPDNLVRWVRDPRSVQPGTAMPALGLAEQEARDVAAYLYTLR
jgi:cytochrome c2